MASLGHKVTGAVTLRGCAFCIIEGAARIQVELTERRSGWNPLQRPSRVTKTCFKGSGGWELCVLLRKRCCLPLPWKSDLAVPP